MIRHPLTIFGEVLFDCFPDGNMILGGAPFNVAWHLQAFGQSPNFISRVGNDAPGQSIRMKMQEWDMNTSLLQTDFTHPTGQVTVSFNLGEPHYDIASNQAYDYIDFESDKELTDGILYHGTLALRSPQSQKSLTAIKQRHRGLIFIDINLRQPWWKLSDVIQLLHHADWIKLNIDEFNTLFNNPTNLEITMACIADEFDLTGIIITLGEEGACALTKKGDFQRITPGNRVAIKDTVGAGDAFSAVLLTGLNLGWELELSMQRAQSFASAIVGLQGAITDDLNFYRDFNQEWQL